MVFLSGEAFLHSGAFGFDTAVAIAREELAKSSLAATARHRAMVELGVARLGLGKLDEAYAALTTVELVRAADIAAIPWSEHVVRVARGDLERAIRKKDPSGPLRGGSDKGRSVNNSSLFGLSARPRPDPSRWAVNVRCVDGVDLSSIVVRQFDGMDWEVAAKDYFDRLK